MTTVALASILLASFVFFGAPHVAAITNANATALMPWSVRLAFTPKDGEEGSNCTGTALSQHWIVTSGHCLQDKSIHSDNITISTENGTLYSGRASYYNHPDYGTDGDRGDDLGLVRLYEVGMIPDITAKVENGPNVVDPSRWNDGASIFYVAGYGRGSNSGEGETCPGDDKGSGVKRLGRFKLTGNSDENGTFGFGNPIAVEAARIGSSICRGDSGAPWSFMNNGNENDMHVFGVHSGNGLRSNPLLGLDEWAALLPPKMRWITDTTAAKGLAIDCPTFGMTGAYSSYRRCTEGHWMLSRRGAGEWRRFQSVSTPLSRVQFGDFDGDGRTGDAFVSAPNGKRYVLYSNATEWMVVMDLTPVLDRLAFGDFDGDGATDVLIQNRTAWVVALATRDRSRWSALFTAKTFERSQGPLEVGDFDGDGLADVIRSTQGRLEVSFASRNRLPWSDWIPLTDSEVSFDRLRFRDFDGDGVTDVFRRRDGSGTWDVSYATSDRRAWSNWTTVGSSQEPLSALAFGDFNGDGASDAFRSQSGAWEVSYAAKGRRRWGRWVEINRSRIALPLLSFADVDGDGWTDALYLSPVRAEARD